MRRASLRLRLFGLILTPLVLMALLLGYWRFTVAQKTAEELFDRSLLAAALAISRDVAVSGGDALALSTRDLIRDASGGEVFYHATGPDGIYVTGYAYPPVPLDGTDQDRYLPTTFEAIYRGDGVRVLQVTENVTIETLSGDATVTVWQRLADRNAFARELAVRAAALMGALLATLALVVWFGVKHGLRPLTDLQDAIGARSPDDLSRIKRPVPTETQGIVQTLNRLFGQVETSIEAHKSFISDAAHQLRNPAAAVLSMAEALRHAKSDRDHRQRVNELVGAARHSARVADQLLSLDRLQQQSLDLQGERFDLVAAVRDLCTELGPPILSDGIQFALHAPKNPVEIEGDRPFIVEAIKNLVDNAHKHGGEALSHIVVELCHRDDQVKITVRDDGAGLSPEQTEVAFNRFSQIEPSRGSGLGLAITKSVVERHGGSLVIDRVSKGASLTLRLPTSR